MQTEPQPPRRRSGDKPMVKQLPTNLGARKSDSFESAFGGSGGGRGGASQRAQLVREVRHFQRVQEEPDECRLPWPLFYTHCRGSLDLPLREQIRLRYRQPDVDFSAATVAAAAASAAKDDPEDKIGKGGGGGGEPSTLLGSVESSLDDYESRLADDDVLDNYHRLLVSYGSRVEWQLYFKSEDQLQKRVREIIGCLTLALLETNEAAGPEIQARISSAITSILVETLAGLINRFARKWRMVFMSDHEESIAAIRSDYERTAVKLRSFLHVSRLSFLASMLRPNPDYSQATVPSPAELSPPTTTGLVAAATTEAAVTKLGRPTNFGDKKIGSGNSSNQPRDISGLSGGSGGSGVSRTSSAVSGAARATPLSLETQSFVWPSQQVWADDQGTWQPSKYLKMFEAPVRLVSASDCLENDACFGAFAAVRRRCQSMIGGPCTGRLGRFCLDRRCSRREKQDSVERWMVVGDTFVGLLNMESNEIEEVMLFDAEFHVLTGKDSKQLGANGMKLINNYCQLHVSFQREVDSRVVARAIELAMSGDTYFYGEDATMAAILSNDATGFGGGPPAASNGFLFSRRLSLMRNTQSSLLSNLTGGSVAGLRISSNDGVSHAAAMEEQALAAAVAAAAAATTASRVGKNVSNTAAVDDRHSDLTAMIAAAGVHSADGSDASFYAEQRQQQNLLRMQRRKRRKKQRETRQSGTSTIGRGAERSERQRPNELEQQRMQTDLDLEVPVHSFAPPRHATKAQWYVDAGSYFYAVADAIDMAQAEIFVCGSVLTPELYLKRPDPDGRYQLGPLLIEKARLRVKVFILLDNPNCLKDTNSCLHVLDYFEGVPNVHIMLSPFDLDDASSAFFKPALGLIKAFLAMRRRLYARCFGRFMPGLRAASMGGGSKSGCRAEHMYYKHNEKCIVIDQKVALVSGVDLTWGTWDTSLHVINDVPTNSTTAMNELGPQQYRGQEACVKTFWMNPATMCSVMTPPIMSCLDEDTTEDDTANVRPGRSEAAMMYLPESLRDLVVPKEKLGMDSDYDNYAHTQRAYMTKPYSVFTDANDPTLNPQYFEAVRLLDSRYRNAVRVAWTFERKSVRMPDLRLFEAPGCLPRHIEEPAYVSEIFQSTEDENKRQTGPAGDLKTEFGRFKQKHSRMEKRRSNTSRPFTNDKSLPSSLTVSETDAAQNKQKLAPQSGAAQRQTVPTPSGAFSSNNSNAESVSLDDLAKYHVCVASCMVMQRDKNDNGVQQGMSDDSDSDDLECFPADMMQPLLRSINRSGSAELKHTNWLTRRIAVERHMASVQRKLLELRLQQGQHQSVTDSAANNGSASAAAAITSADAAQLSKRKQLLIESLETTSELRQPLLKRHFAVKDDGSRFTTRLFPGLDYANSRLLTLTEDHHNHPDNPPSSLDPEREPRLPVHSVGLAIFGSAARDVARHFIQRWNFACTNVYRQARRPVQVGSHGKALEAFLDMPLLVPRFYVGHDLEDCELLVRRTECLRSVLDYPNTGRRLSLSNQTVNVLVLNLDEGRNRRSGFESDDRQQQQRKHQQQQPQKKTTDKSKSGGGAGGGGNSMSDDVRRDLARNEQTLQGANVANMPVFLTEKSINSLEGNEVVRDEEFENCLERLSQGRVPHSCRVTVLRSLGKWSGGLYRQLEERSILQAYYSAIKTARRFLYLESELFVSQSRNRCPSTALVQNRVSFYMYKRILAARQAGEAFRIYLVIPLLPRHQGRLLSETDGDYVNRRAMQHVYGAIFRGEDSLVHRLLQRNIAPDEYLSVCSLQKYERIPDGWLAQDIYVQSNLLIADDRLAIIGSPSVTDHGLLGYKNSELAIRLEDPPSSGGIGGSGGFVRTLRLTLWGEHLDMPARFREAAIGDPGEAAVWALWRGRATRNSQIMYEVFRSVPNNAANTIERLRDFTSLDYLRRRAKLYSSSRAAVGQGLEKLAGFCGNLVRYSGHFLEGNDLTHIDEDSKRWRAALLWPDFALV